MNSLVRKLRVTVRCKQRCGRNFSSSVYVRSQKIGIVGLPNVGKSLLFNALMGKSIARSENFPFCTVNPNSAVAEYPDPRLKAIAKIQKPKKITPVGVQFVDIAGLVEGASEGSGLGNQFLDNIKNVDVILHVVRAFSNEINVSHVLDTVDPVRDVKIISNELLQKDLQNLESYRRSKGAAKNSKFEPKEVARVADLVYNVLKSGKSMQDTKITRDHPDFECLDSMKLLSAKPVLYVANVDENSAANGNEFSVALQQYITNACTGNQTVVVSAALEFELATLEDQKMRKEMAAGYGLTQNGIEVIIRSCFDLLGLVMYYTMGPKEVRGWPIPRNTKTREAAGVIHSDFVKGFVKAEMWTYDDYIKTNGKPTKTVKGADHVVQDGECYEFKIKG